MQSLGTRKIGGQLQLTFGTRLVAQARQRQTQVVMGRLVLGRILNGTGQLSPGLGKVLPSVRKDAEAGERTAMVRVALQRLLKQGPGCLRLPSVKRHLPQLKVRLRLQRSELDRTLKLMPRIFTALLHLEQVPHAEVRRSVIWTDGKIAPEMTLGVAEVFPVQLHARQRVKCRRIGGFERESGLQRLLRNRQLMHLLSLNPEIKEQDRIVRQVLPGVLETEKRSLRFARLFGSQSQFPCGRKLSLPRPRVAKIDSESRLKPLHRLRVVALRQQQIAKRIVGSGVIRARRQGAYQQSLCLLRIAVVGKRLGFSRKRIGTIDRC